MGHAPVPLPDRRPSGGFARAVLLRKPIHEAARRDSRPRRRYVHGPRREPVSIAGRGHRAPSRRRVRVPHRTPARASDGRGHAAGGDGRTGDVDRAPRGGSTPGPRRALGVSCRTGGYAAAIRAEVEANRASRRAVVTEVATALRTAVKPNP